MKAYKTELAPNDKQRTFFESCADVRAFIYNWGLTYWRWWYADGKRPSAWSLRKHFNSIKYDECPWVTDVPYAITEAAFEGLGNAFKHFFRRIKSGETPGYPKYKKAGMRRTFQLKGIKTAHDNVWLGRKMGWVRLKERGYIPTEVLRYGIYATISERAGRWFISVLVHEAETDPIPRTDDVIGIDLGLKTRAVLSNGEEWDMPKPMYEYAKKLARLNRELSRRKKGSQNWYKTKVRIARLYAKMANVRKWWHHEISHHVTADLQPRVIVLENLNVAGMVKNRHLAKAISDAGFSALRAMIEYKAERYGIGVVIADRWLASSKTCSGCGYHNAELTLSDRTYVCPECGLEIDRDLNAAQNLKALAA